MENEALTWIIDLSKYVMLVGVVIAVYLGFSLFGKKASKNPDSEAG